MSINLADMTTGQQPKKKTKQQKVREWFKDNEILTLLQASKELEIQPRALSATISLLNKKGFKIEPIIQERKVHFNNRFAEQYQTSGIKYRKV